MSTVFDVLTVLAVGLGVLFFLAGTVGLVRFPDPLSRVHALTKADNLGLGLVVLGLLPQVASPIDLGKLVVIWLLVLLASAATGQLMGRSLRSDGLDRAPRSQEPGAEP